MVPLFLCRIFVLKTGFNLQVNIVRKALIKNAKLDLLLFYVILIQLIFLTFFRILSAMKLSIQENPA
jgi:hypothetical protein